MLSLLAVTLLAAAPADDFASRVSRAKALEKTASGEPYQIFFAHDIRQRMITTLRGCIASNQPANTSPFTIVADITATGRAQNVQVQPATPVATCLAGQFGEWQFQNPPKDQGSPYPIEIDITL